jgi:DNA-directed RNA polymerase subunit delta
LPQNLYLHLPELHMAKNTPNNDSNLNRVDLSLHEFLEGSWKKATTSHSNPAALEMLLMPNDDNILPNDTQDETPFIRRRDSKRLISTNEMARVKALQKREYVKVAKLTYPSTWYIIRTTQAILTAGLKRAYHTFGIGYRTIYLLTDFIWLVLTPFRRLLGVLIGDEYERATRAFRTRVHRNRLWLGRSRGYTYLSAFYHRCRYIVGYFSIHQFYQIDLFLRNTLTIRRGIQAILPVGLLCSVVYKTTIVPSLVDTRGSHGLENTTKKLSAKPNDRLTQLFVADEVYPLDIDLELTRAESGMLYNKEMHPIIEFITGAYTEVEKTKLVDVIHPNEVFTYLEMDKSPVPTKANVYTTQSDLRIGKFEVDIDKLDQMQDPPTPPPGEEKDEETELAEFEEQRAAFIPEPAYKVLREEDDDVREQYTFAEKVRQYRAHHKKRLAYKQNSKRNPYVEAMPYVQTERTGVEKTKRRYTTTQRSTVLEALPLGDNVSNNISWIEELLNAFYLGQKLFPNMDFTQWDNRIAEVFSAPEPHIRAVLSPFGITTDIGETNKLTSHSTNETKIFPYSFKNSRSLLNAVGVGTYNTETHQGIKYVLELFREPDEFGGVLYDWAHEPGASVFDLNDEDDDDDNWSDAKWLDDDEQDDDFDDEDDDFDDADDDLNDEDDDFDDADDDLNDEDDNNFYGEDDDLNDEDDDFDDADDDLDDEDDDNFSDEEDDDFGDEDGIFGDNEEKGTFHISGLSTVKDVNVTPDQQAELLSLLSPVPLWNPHVTLFIESTPSLPWQSSPWKNMVLQLMMYASIEFCIRLECRGIRVRLKPLPNVHRLIPHLGRLPEGVPARNYVGETMDTVQVRKLLLAFQARRGTELYGQSQWTNLWNLVIRPNMSATQALYVETTRREWSNKLSNMFNPKNEQDTPVVVRSRNVIQHTSLPKTATTNIEPRYFGFDKLTEAIQTYTHRKTDVGTNLTSSVLAERQKHFNRFGGENTITRALTYGKRIQEEICHFPLFALIKPGTQKMHRLPKGMILLGDPGNGRTYFVRTLATESRLPLLITESNRYLDQSLGLVRLRTLFKRVRDQAPNILFIRDMDFMTRHRERYPMFTSVRATTQLLMAIDGYSRGTETIPSEQDIFVIGSMTTTIMMDDACMRSGRFEWLLNFYYPPVKERHNMFVLHSTKSIVNKTTGVDWNYFTAMTEGFSCLDIRTIVNTSAVYALKQKSTLHTNESVAFALGTVNQIHDLPEVTFNSVGTRSFFLRADYAQRHNNMAQHASFFTQTGHVPMYKKLMHFFNAMLSKETETLAARWNMQQCNQRTNVEVEPDRTLATGLLPLFCEGVFLYNTQKMCGHPYPIVAFDTYCAPLFVEMKQMVDDMSLEHTLERITKTNLFVTTFDLWRRSHPNDWTPTALFDNKSIAMRTNATTMWRSSRFSKKYSVIGGLTELEGEILWGPPPIATKIKNRISFIGENTPEFASRDPMLFGTFETHSDLSFKCRKKSTARRINQVSMEILDVMQKHWQ